MNGRGIAEYRCRLEQEKGRAQHIREEIASAEQSISSLTVRGVDIGEARALLQACAQATQKELEYHISELVTLALSSVLPEPYTLNVDFVIKRGRTEAELSFSRPSDPSHKIPPMDTVGGGAVDVGAFALRVSTWSLKNPRSRNTIIIDEPFRFLSRGLQGKAAEMLHEISHRLNIQIIMVSHIAEQIDGADRIFANEMSSRGISRVTVKEQHV